MKRDERAERRPYHHGDLRRALLEAAEEELTERGPEGFTLRGCAKRAGVSHAAPAHHFGDVSGLLSALAAEAFARFVATMERRAAASGATEPRARLVAIGIGYVEFARANPALFRLMFSSTKPDYALPDLSRNASAAFRHLVDSVGALHDDAPLASPEGRQHVAAIWAIVHGLSDLLLSGQLGFIAADGEEALERDMTAILRTVIAGIPG
jgi:AcrR family transcriptional regulator